MPALVPASSHTRACAARPFGGGECALLPPVVAQGVGPGRPGRRPPRVTGHHRQIQLEDPSAAQRQRPLPRRREALRDHQRATGDAIELVRRCRREAQGSVPWGQFPAQPGHDGIRLAMDRQAGGLGNHQAAAGAIQDARCRTRRALCPRLAGGPWPRRRSVPREHGVHPDQVGRPGTGGRDHAQPVDANVPLAQRLVESRQRYPRQQPAHHPIDPPVDIIGVDPERRMRRLRQTAHRVTVAPA